MLGDDLALNAQQVAGVKADRELPVVWAVAKGSLLNKAILVPAALAISALAPWAVMPLLMIGGAFLCYEGVEKLAHKFLHSKAEDAAHHAELVQAWPIPRWIWWRSRKTRSRAPCAPTSYFRPRSSSSRWAPWRTASFVIQVAVLTGIAIIMTVGVYGLVAGIVKLDDGGLHLSRREGDAAFARLQRAIGRGILRAAPWLMKGLSIAGTAAMFLVGGAILVHGVPALHHWIEELAERAGVPPGVGGVLQFATNPLLDAVVGIAAGALLFAVVSGVQRVLRPRTATP